jgi:alkylated DNA repair dioxygenase AlkB
MARSSAQRPLFDTGASLPNGFVYRPDFITPEEEAELLSYFADLPFSHSRLGEYVAKRRIIGFGWGYDFRDKKLVPGPSLPPFLSSLQRKVAKWLDISTHRVAEALITEYPPGSAIGWHRDNESFEHIVGISLSGWCRMRLRPLSWRDRGKQEVISLPLEPRSAYIMQKDARWKFQHSVSKVEGLRYSITFRTLPKGIVPIPKRKLRTL